MRQTRSQTRTKSVADTNGNSTKSLEYNELKVSFCFRKLIIDSLGFPQNVPFISSLLDVYRLDEEYF